MPAAGSTLLPRKARRLLPRFHFLLIFVHFFIRAVKYIRKLSVRVRIIDSKAVRNPDRNICLICLYEALSALQIKLGAQRLMVLKIAVFENHYKFIAADSENRAPLECARDEPGRGDDQLVARLMAVLIVGFLTVMKKRTQKAA